MIVFYLCFEDVLFSFLPHSRRGNTYARRLNTAYNVTEILNAYTVEQLEKIWYRQRNRARIKDIKESKYHDSRYTGVNLHSLFSDGHLEIRYHSGTLNAIKILEWTALHQAILDGAVGKTETLNDTLTVQEPYYTVDQAMQSLHITNQAEKTRLFFQLLRLPERAQQYWIERQKTFDNVKENIGEAQSLTETLCAE
jgi:hypothetical protein